MSDIAARVGVSARVAVDWAAKPLRGELTDIVPYDRAMLETRF
jgi:hypothetical protein